MCLKEHLCSVWLSRFCKTHTSYRWKENGTLQDTCFLELSSLFSLLESFTETPWNTLIFVVCRYKRADIFIVRCEYVKFGPSTVRYKLSTAVGVVIRTYSSHTRNERIISDKVELTPLPHWGAGYSRVSLWGLSYKEHIYFGITKQ